MSEAALFKSQIGADWEKVDKRIQIRFDADPNPGKPIYYKGTMKLLKRSWFGWILAKMTFFTDGAFCAWNGIDIPAEIEVYKEEGCDDICKVRRYYFPNKKKPYIFISRMHLNAKGDLLEFVGAGFGMIVKVKEKDGALFFTNGSYFLQIGSIRLTIPALLSPGKVILTHTNIGANQFRIEIDITHPIFGQVFYQDGIFEDSIKI